VKDVVEQVNKKLFHLRVKKIMQGAAAGKQGKGKKAVEKDAKSRHGAPQNALPVGCRLSAVF
jgi:hypothetical protein